MHNENISPDELDWIDLMYRSGWEVRGGKTPHLGRTSVGYIQAEQSAALIGIVAGCTHFVLVE